MGYKKQTHGARRSLASLIVLGCLSGTAGMTNLAHADATSDLLAEVTAQKARLEALEKKLEAVTKEAAAAKESARVAQQAVATTGSASEGALTMPKNFAIYGIADAGLEYGNYGQGKKVRVQSGLGSASRLGFKGQREFGDDMMAYFQLEAGVSYDNGQNTGHSSNISNPGGTTTSSSAAPNTTGVAIFSRNTFVGLKSKIGDIRFGRDYAPIYSITSASDPFIIGGATAFRLWSSAGLSRFDNGVYYASPKLAGFRFNGAYSAGMENNTNANVGLATGSNTAIGPKDEGKGSSASLTYENGPLFLGAGYLGYYKTGSTNTGTATENVRRTSWNLAATYDIKVAKLYGHYLSGKDEQAGATTPVSLDRRVYWLGVSVPVGEVHTLRAVYAHLDDKLATNRDSTHLGFGYEYALDKQTDLYAYYAQVTNKNGGTNSLCAGGTCQGYDSGTNLPANFTPKSLMLGGRYRF